MNIFFIKLFFIIFVVFGENSFSAISSKNLPSSKEKDSLIKSKDYKVLELFSNEYEVPSELTFKKISESVFTTAARKKAVSSFKGKGISTEAVNNFKAQFDDYMFNYEYIESHHEAFDYFEEGYDEEQYKLRKQFAFHMAEKVGDYHFNRYIKYHPRIKDIVKKVEDIELSVKFPRSQEDVSVKAKKNSQKSNYAVKKKKLKPTELKLRPLPFKSAIRFEVLHHIVDSKLYYKISTGNLDLNLTRRSKLFNLNFHYRLGRFHFSKPVKQYKTFETSVDKKIYRDLTAKLSLETKNGPGKPTVANLLFSIPFHNIF